MKKKIIIIITAILILIGASYLFGPTLFIKTLERQTVNKKLDWHNIFELSDSYDDDSFDFVLFTNATHTIDELNSYEIVKEDGLSIFLIDEQFESGKDGTVSGEKNLYVLRGINGKLYNIPIKDKDFMSLQDKISAYLNN